MVNSGQSLPQSRTSRASERKQTTSFVGKWQDDVEPFKTIVGIHFGAKCECGDVLAHGVWYGEIGLSKGERFLKVLAFVPN